ncbi:glycosyltransferase family 2 protein [Sphingomonas sp.]|jgi:hypothetical protein|uniref:glycosyltransferase family 2 protein n=1 Tax=Sphingomonas sp. TaxID=28214 RepID=UPI002D7F6B5F|nr:glycosyltransferase family 2 protein [Sphingomonas sp.]HEU0045930.1 glycosyltransferase family 2 protein [Sphingomonas sp.]
MAAAGQDNSPAAHGQAVDVVIVNWNAGDQLATCLQSLARFGDGLIRSVVVVDNGSTDGSADFEVPGLSLRIIRAGENLGFGRACNLGAADAAAPLLLFLNPDAAVLPDALSRAVAFMATPEADDIGVLGIQLIDEDGDVHHHSTDRASPRTMFTHAQRAVRFDHLHSREVDHVIGAFYLIRTELFRSLGGFDERFFVYLEDVDLSARVQDAGWRVHYLAEARAFHRGGGTSDQVKAKRLFYALRSRVLYGFKHFSFASAVAVTAATLLAEPGLRLGRAVMRRSMREVHETLGAYGRLYRDLPAILRAARRGRP